MGHRNSIFLIALLVLPGGCHQSDPLARCGIELRLPPTWSLVEPDRFVVPGDPLAAWVGPEGASLSLFTTLRDPGATAETILEGTANLWANSPGWSFERQVVDHESIPGVSAARLELVAPGTGDQLAPIGRGRALPRTGDNRPLVPTRRVAFIVPRDDFTLYLFWHLPETARETLNADIQATLATLSLAHR